MFKTLIFFGFLTIVLLLWKQQQLAEPIQQEPKNIRETILNSLDDDDLQHQTGKHLSILKLTFDSSDLSKDGTFSMPHFKPFPAKES